MTHTLGRLALLLGALFVATGSARSEPAPLNVPILLHGGIGQDACPEQGRVVAVDAAAAGALAVQSGPGDAFREVGRVGEGETVAVCERLAGWLGVVYGSDPLGCQTTILLPGEREYTGPCGRGWVPAGNVSTDRG